MFPYLAMAVNEYIITFDQEIRLVWKRKRMLTSLLLVTTRYALLLAQIGGWVPGSSKAV